MSEKNYKNNKNKKFKKITFKSMSKKSKTTLLTLGMILLIFAVLAGVYALMNRKDTVEGYELYKVSWKSGTLNSEDGSLVNDKGFMYSKPISCNTTLFIERDFESNIDYKVYYYDKLGNLVHIDSPIGTALKYYGNIEDLETQIGKDIEYARILCKWTYDDDYELSYFERLDLASKINVYVATVNEGEV